MPGFGGFGDGLMPSAGQATTNIIHLNRSTITKALLTVSGAVIPGDSITYELSANAGTNWETVTSGTEHTFVTTGSALKARVTMVGIGGVNTHLKELRVKVTETV